MKQSFLIIFIIVLALGWHLPDAIACSCVPPVYESISTAVKQNLAGSDAVFSAEAIEVKNYEGGAAESVQLAKFRVIKSWKGPHKPGDLVRTKTPSNRGYCGFLVKKGEQLLLYQLGSEPYALMVCSRSSHLDRAVADLNILDELADGKGK